LSAEAIRIGRLLVELLPEPEAIGLLALITEGATLVTQALSLRRVGP
jgi:predicted RNA polymerase sigma factor